jgi:hypothetical protein
MRLVRRVNRDYRIDRVIGLYPPRFVARLAVAQLAGAISTELSTRLEDRAMQDLFTYGPAWRLSYVVVLAGER